MTQPEALDRRAPSLRRIIQISILFSLLKLSLRLFGLRRLYILLGRFSPRVPANSGRTVRSLLEARRIAEEVSRIHEDYLLFGANCLVESLAMWWLLRRRGIAADFRIGVRTLTGIFESHAWVEYNGTSLNDIESVGQVYTPFDLSRIPPGIKKL